MSFWDLYQQMQISSMESNAKSERRRQRRKGLKTERRLEDLETEIEQLKLLCTALVRVATDAGQLDSDRLQKLLYQIDAEDGVVDGRITEPESRREATHGAPTRNAPTRKRRHT